MLMLFEDTRNQLINKSKSADLYKGVNTGRGKNRFERRVYSKIANQVKSYNEIDMNKLFKSDLLEVNIPVIGETDQYSVTLSFDGVIAEIARNIKSNHNKFEYRTVLQALTKIFNTTNIKVKCTCKDFKYRYQHQLIVNNNSVDGTDKDPGPGRTGMANTQGKGCKHILAVLNNLS
ncbi:MAG: SWIM zinc finger family protein [Bacilli bacterium]|nr:SWIM zinc finger family protein [Bacilli bacterium]